INVAGVLSTLLVVFFAISLSRDADIPNLLLPEEKRPYHQLREKERRHINRSTAHRRKPGSKASELVLNSGEPVRAAFYVQWDAGSYASLREYGHQIDLLFPEFLHVLTADGHLQGVTDDNRIFDVMQGTKVTPVDTKVMNFDQQFPEGAPGAIAGQEWFVKNLQHALKVMPREKLICAIASYGYDWPRKKAPAETVENLSVQGAWLTARESEADIDFHPD